LEFCNWLNKANYFTAPNQPKVGAICRTYPNQRKDPAEESSRPSLTPPKKHFTPIPFQVEQSHAAALARKIENNLQYTAL